MPFRAEVLTEHRVGLLTGFGDVTGAEIADACRALVEGDGWAPGFDQVWTLGGARSVGVAPDELTALVASTRRLADRVGDGRCVVVDTRDGVAAVLRLFQRLTADLDRTYHRVRTLDEAAAWLGLPPGALAAGAGGP